MAPIHVRQQVRTLHEPPLRGLLPRGGGEGGSALEAKPDEGSNRVFMTPIRVSQQVFPLHEPQL